MKLRSVRDTLAHSFEWGIIKSAYSVLSLSEKFSTKGTDTLEEVVKKAAMSAAVRGYECNFAPINGQRRRGAAIYRVVGSARMIRIYPSIALLAMMFLAGCGNSKGKIPAKAKTALEKAERFELYSLDPDVNQYKRDEEFHGWKILGKTLIEDADSRRNLIAAFEKAVSENTGNFDKCFNPRHGIRTIEENKVLDFVICFHCYQVQLYKDGEKIQGFLTMRSAQPEFDEVLRRAGVTLAKNPPE